MGVFDSQEEKTRKLKRWNSLTAKEQAMERLKIKLRWWTMTKHGDSNLYKEMLKLNRAELKKEIGYDDIQLKKIVLKRLKKKQDI